MLHSPSPLSIIKKAPRIKGYKSCYCVQGHWHHGTGEARYCDKLHILKKAKCIKKIERQVHYDFYVNGKFIYSHRPDFRVTRAGGRIEIHEYKGLATEIWKIQKRLFEALHPNIPYVVKTSKDLL